MLKVLMGKKIQKQKGNVIREVETLRLKGNTRDQNHHHKNEECLLMGSSVDSA